MAMEKGVGWCGAKARSGLGMEDAGLRDSCVSG